MKSNLITITFNDHNMIVERVDGGVITPGGFYSDADIITVEKKRDNGRVDVYYYSIDYRPEIFDDDHAFIQALPEHARARILHAARNEFELTDDGFFYRYTDVKPEKVNAFYNELKKEKAHQAKMKKARAIMEKMSAGAVLNIDETIFIKECFNDSISTGSGKLKNIDSISTAVFLNGRCKRNAKNKKWICSKCYAMKYAGLRSDLSRKLELNTLLYTTCIIPVEFLPEINARYFRFESFGDLNNAVQQANYFNISKKNSGVFFAQWSKNPDITADAIAAGYNKPDNLRYVYSSPLINVVAPDDIMNKYSFIDEYFTVYDPQYIADNDVSINCYGAAAGGCINCLNCYRKDGAQYVNEKLK